MYPLFRVPLHEQIPWLEPASPAGASRSCIAMELACVHVASQSIMHMHRNGVGLRSFGATMMSRKAAACWKPAPISHLQKPPQGLVNTVQLLCACPCNMFIAPAHQGRQVQLRNMRQPHLQGWVHVQAGQVAVQHGDGAVLVPLVDQALQSQRVAPLPLHLWRLPRSGGAGFNIACQL